MAQPNDATAFTAAAKAAMNEILRARTQSGVARNDPLDPLVVALARTIDVLGQMPAAIDQQQKAITTASQAMANKAQAEMEASLAVTAETLVNNLGGAVTAKEKWKWSAACVAVVGLVALGSEWLGQTWAVQNAEARADARIVEMQSRYNAELAQARHDIPKTYAWSQTILPTNATDGAPYPCISWGQQGAIRDRPGYEDRQPVVTCQIALRWQ